MVLGTMADFDGNVDTESRVASAAMCFPAVGRHLSFDGRLLHAAPRDLAPPTPLPAEAASLPTDAAPAIGDATRPAPVATTTATAAACPDPDRPLAPGARVTFLVNVWLQHRPNGIRPFPTAMLPCLSARSLGLGNGLFPRALGGGGGGESESGGCGGESAKAAGAKVSLLSPPELPWFPAALPAFVSPVSSGGAASATAAALDVPEAAAAPRTLVFPFSRAGTSHAVTLVAPGGAGCGLGDAAALGAVRLRMRGGSIGSTGLNGGGGGGGTEGGGSRGGDGARAFEAWVSVLPEEEQENDEEKAEGDVAPEASKRQRRWPLI